MACTIPAPEFFTLAEAIVNSDPVLSIFAACQWDELNDDGHVWLAKIVEEAIRHGPPNRKEQTL